MKYVIQFNWEVSSAVRHIDLEALARTIRIMDSPKLQNSKDDDKDLYRHFVNAHARSCARVLQKSLLTKDDNKDLYRHFMTYEVKKVHV